MLQSLAGLHCVGEAAGTDNNGKIKTYTANRPSPFRFLSVKTTAK
jgi:hypothetical protein